MDLVYCKVHCRRRLLRNYKQMNRSVRTKCICGYVVYGYIVVGARPRIKPQTRSHRQRTNEPDCDTEKCI